MHRKTQLLLLTGLLASICARPATGQFQFPGPTPEEGRIAISSLPVTLNTPGSYYLTGCLTGAPLMDGITVTADDVTIDLNGFALIGAPSSDDGVVATGDRFTIFNGTVRGFTEDGIRATGDGALIMDVRSSENGFDGIECSQVARVVRCFTYANGLEGICVDRGSVIEDCIALENTTGIRAGLENGSVRHNVVSSSSGVGIHGGAATAWCYDQNAVGFNGDDGLIAGNRSLVIDNLSLQNATNVAASGIELSGSDACATGNFIYLNDFGVTMALNGDNVFARNVVSFNTTNFPLAAGNDFGSIVGSTVLASAWANISH